MILTGYDDFYILKDYYTLKPTKYEYIHYKYEYADSIDLTLY